MKVKKDLLLVLDEQEAEWLKNFIQNYPADLSNEDPKDREKRQELFETLKKFLEYISV